MKTIITAVASFALGIGVAGGLAEAGSPIYEVTEINVKDRCDALADLIDTAGLIGSLRPAARSSRAATTRPQPSMARRLAIAS